MIVMAPMSSTEYQQIVPHHAWPIDPAPSPCSELIARPHWHGPAVYTSRRANLPSHSWPIDLEQTTAHSASIGLCCDSTACSKPPPLPLPIFGAASRLRRQVSWRTPQLTANSDSQLAVKLGTSTPQELLNKVQRLQLTSPSRAAIRGLRPTERRGDLVFRGPLPACSAPPCEERQGIQADHLT